MQPVNVRNLEQIQEDETRPRGSRLGTLLLASVAGAALVVVGLVTAKRSGPPAKSADDPLAQLVSQSKTEGKTPEKIDGRDVTFPGLLSDEEKPTTALAAVKDERGRLLKQEPAAPEPLPERRARRPRPAIGCRSCRFQPARCSARRRSRDEPKDSLTLLASNASQIDDSVELAPRRQRQRLPDPGRKLQRSTRRRQVRRRPAQSAVIARSGRRPTFPAADSGTACASAPSRPSTRPISTGRSSRRAERVSPYVIDPHKMKEAEEVRAQKLEVRIKRFGKP